VRRFRASNHRQQPCRPVRARRGLTLIEVLIASVILSVAGLAALELLARSDSSSLFARRQALASVEAERILNDAATLVKSQRPAAHSEELDAGSAAEALGGCTATVRETRELMSIKAADGGAVRVPVVRLTAEIRDPAGNELVSLERVVPTAAAEDAP
jgi:prepilin-type N-terminal cleavage/methylation domain-containing protein